MLTRKELKELFWNDVVTSPCAIGVVLGAEQEEELKNFLDDASKIFSIQWVDYKKNKSVNLPTFLSFVLSQGIALGLRLDVENGSVKKE